jgi:hypothetical protein
LIATAWNPSRFVNWCLDLDEQENIVHTWNQYNI